MDYLFNKLNSLESKKQTYLALAIFAVLVVLFYGNTLSNGFVSDDVDQIERNGYVHSLSNLPRYSLGVQ